LILTDLQTTAERGRIPLGPFPFTFSLPDREKMMLRMLFPTPDGCALVTQMGNGELVCWDLPPARRWETILSGRPRPPA
jgi:hypothetical protein